MTDLPKVFCPQEVREFFDAHWTVRKYKKFALPAEHLDTILSAAQRAPTDATAQMYSFVRLTNEPLRARIAQATTNAHIATASESFVVCGDLRRLEDILLAHGYEPGVFPAVAIHFAIGDAVMAGQNLLIAAEMLGYRGCWIGGVLNGLADIADALKLPEGVFPFAALTIGVPDEAPQHRPRLPRAQIFHENTYRIAAAQELRDSCLPMDAISARGDWPQTLARYFSRGGTMESRETTLQEYLNRHIRGRL